MLHSSRAKKSLASCSCHLLWPIAVGPRGFANSEPPPLPPIPYGGRLRRCFQEAFSGYEPFAEDLSREGTEAALRSSAVLRVRNSSRSRKAQSQIGESDRVICAQVAHLRNMSVSSNIRLAKLVADVSNAAAPLSASTSVHSCFRSNIGQA